MRKIVFIILIVVFSSIYYYSTVENENSLAFQLKKEVNSMTQSMKSATSTLKNDTQMPQKESESPISKTDSGVDLGNMTEPQLNDWLRQESARMDMTNNDTAQIEIKLKASALTLKADQFKALSAKILNFEAPANERILSAYLMTLNPTPEATEAQFNLAKEPLHDFGPPNPHSEAELKRAQELALRYMEVDDLADRGKTDANALDKLKVLVTKAEAEEVRRYAARKIKKLSL